jgi:CDP-glucose 4,6-dehydratase
VLEPLTGYLLYLEHLAREPATPRVLNFGPSSPEIITAQELASSFIGKMNSALNVEIATQAYPESVTLAIDASKALESIGWRTLLTVDAALALTAEWYQAYFNQHDVRALTLKQIDDYWATA